MSSYVGLIQLRLDVLQWLIWIQGFFCSMNMAKNHVSLPF